MLKTISSITNALGALNFKGTWDANANSPALTSSVGTKGDYYVVGTAGTTNLNGISNWGVGDWATYNGSVWQRVEGGANLNGVDLSVSGTSTLSGLTASTALALDASKNIVSVTNTGTGNNVLATAPTFSGALTTNDAYNLSNGTGVRAGGSGQYIVGADSGGFFQNAPLGSGTYYTVTTSGGSTSDAVLKTNVQQLIGALDKVCAIRGVNFEFIEQPLSTSDQGIQLGVIAQEVEAQFPEIVVTQDDGIKSVRYDRLVAPLIEAVKELKAELDVAKAEIAALKAK
jgi:hypothetical protein